MAARYNTTIIHMIIIKISIKFISVGWPADTVGPSSGFRTATPRPSRGFRLSHCRPRPLRGSRLSYYHRTTRARPLAVRTEYQPASPSLPVARKSSQSSQREWGAQELRGGTDSGVRGWRRASSSSLFQNHSLRSVSMKAVGLDVFQSTTHLFRHSHSWGTVREECPRTFPTEHPGAAPSRSCSHTPRSVHERRGHLLYVFRSCHRLH